MNRLLIVGLFVIALFLVACAPEVDPEGNPVPKAAVAGQAVYNDLTLDMLKNGVMLTKGGNSFTLNSNVGPVKPADLFKNVEASVTYVYKSSPKEMYRPGQPPFKGWGSLNTLNHGVKYYVTVKKNAMLVYVSPVSSPIPPVCDGNHPELCLTETDCQGGKIKWEGGKCVCAYGAAAAGCNPPVAADLSQCKDAKYDYNGDGFVGKKDNDFLAKVVMSKQCPTGKVCDITGDGNVKVTDLQAFVLKFKPCVDASIADASLEPFIPCTETDKFGIADIGTKGVTKGYFKGLFVELVDYCLNETFVVEHICAEDSLTIKYTSPHGCWLNTVCQDGACVYGCVDPDMSYTNFKLNPILNETSLLFKTTIEMWDLKNKKNMKTSDGCDGNKVAEAFCVNTTTSDYVSYECPSGMACQDGACK